MAKFTIELPDTWGVTSRDVGVEVPVARFTPEIVAKLALHGLTQKVADSAAGAIAAAGFEGRRYKDLTEAERAAVNDHAKAAMAGTVDALAKGEWSERRAGEAVDPVTARVRVLFGALLRDKAKNVWATVKGLEGADRGKRLDELLATQPEDFRAELTKEAETQLRAEAKMKERTAKLNLSINI